MRRWLLALALAATALQGPSHGQVRLPDASDRFAWHPPARQTANILSNVTMGGQVVWASVESWRGEHRKRDFGRQGCSFGLAQGFALTSKAVFSRERPDHSNDHSYFSGHSATSFSQGWELSGGTAYFRVAAAKHDGWDVLTGALVGFGVRSLCSALIK